MTKKVKSTISDTVPYLAIDAKIDSEYSKIKEEALKRALSTVYSKIKEEALKGETFAYCIVKGVVSGKIYKQLLKDGYDVDADGIDAYAVVPMEIYW